jgi:large subunit ribosomal protein L31e
MAEKTETKVEKKNELEREYTIPLRSQVNKVPTYKRANKAIRTIKEFLVRHMKIRDRDLDKVKIDRYLNEFIWYRGIKKPPAKIKVKVTMDGEFVRAELADIGVKYGFKKAKLERRSQKALESTGKKKTGKATEQKTEEKTEEEKAEEAKEIVENKASVIEAGRKMEKQAAKQMKHISGGKDKEPKHPHRMSLRK